MRVEIGISHRLEMAPRHREDPFISPTDGWQRVHPEVKLNKEGPGCPVGCIYCNQKFFNRVGGDPEGERMAPFLYPGVEPGISINTRLAIGKDVVWQIPPQLAVAKLMNYPFYTPATSILLENFNDVAIDFRRTLTVAQKLVERRHQGALAFYTKMGLGEKQMKELAELKMNGGKPVVVISYAGLPQAIEPIGSESRLRTANLAFERNIPVLWSLRPVIGEINTNRKTILEVIGEMANYATAVAIGGLYVDPQGNIVKAFEEAGYPLSGIYHDHDFNIVKVKKGETFELIRQIAKEEGVEIPFYNHTACALAYIMTTVYGSPTANRKAHWMDEWPVCQRICPDEQRVVCLLKAQQELSQVIELAKDALEKLGYYDYEIIPSKIASHKLLIVDGSLTWEELAYVSEVSGWRIDNLPPWGILYSRIREVFDKKNLNKNLVKGGVLIGEDWFVFLEGNLDGNNNQSLVKWIRSQAQARVQVVNIEELKRLKVGGFLRFLDLSYPDVMNLISKDERDHLRLLLEKYLEFLERT